MQTRPEQLSANAKVQQKSPSFQHVNFLDEWAKMDIIYNHSHKIRYGKKNHIAQTFDYITATT